MRNYLLLILLILTGLNAQAQFPSTPRTPRVGTNVYRDKATGIMSEKGVTGAAKVMLIDPAQTIRPITMAALRASNYTQDAITPRVVNITDASGGIFVWDPTDSATPDNTGTALVTSNGQRFKRVVSENRLTPEMFGAISADGLDDGPALTAFFTTTNYALHFPGKYRSGVALARINKGNTSITAETGARIEFFNDTDGISIVNVLNGGFYGAISIENLEIISAGAKSAGRQALLITSQHEQRPGPVVKNISVQSKTAGQEWTTGLHLQNCSATSVSGYDFESAGNTIATGIRLSADTGRPSVEHNIDHFNIRRTLLGIGMAAPGIPGIEGVQLSNGSIVDCFQGIKAVTAYGAPYFGLTNVHVNSFGGEAVYYDGPQQITFSKCLFYVNKSAGGVIPAQGVYIKNTIFCSGEITLVTNDNVPDAVRIAGTGGGVNMALSAAVFSAQTNLVRVEDTFLNGATFETARIWNGNTTWGTVQGKDIIGPASRRLSVSSATGRLPATIETNFTTLGWSSTNYNEVLPPALLADATVYLVKMIYDRSGQDRTVQSWLVPISLTDALSVGVPLDLVGNRAVFGVSTERYFKLRLKKGASTFGLEALPSTVDMISAQGAVTLSIIPLH